MFNSELHQAALNRILAAAHSYYVLNHRFPSRIRLGADIARDYLGAAVEAQFLLRPSESDERIVVVADPTLSPTEITFDD
jgi:hypothetical protein